MPLTNVKPIDIHIHPFTEETCLGHGPSYTEAHHNFFGLQEDAPHHGRKTLAIEETYQTFKEGGIDKAVFVNMVSYNQWGRALPNDYLAKYCQQYPDMFYALAGIDPHMPSKRAVMEVERVVKDLGCIGLKFHPAYQECHPNDKEKMYPILEACEALDVSVLIHTGTTRMTRCKIRSCNPIDIDDIATDFPKLRIIMTHFGWPWTGEALAVAWRHENVYLDCSGWMPRYIYMSEPIVFQYMNTVLADKFVFGSDYPAIHPRLWLNDFDNIVENGFEWGGKKRNFRPENYDKFLRHNAIKALKLNID